MPEYHYKPAALRPAHGYRLAEGVLCRLGADGAVSDFLNLVKVDEANYVELGTRKTLMRRLDLLRSGQRWSLSYTGSLSKWQSNPDARTHLDLMIAAAAALAKDRPGLEVSVGETGVSRWIMFLIGVAALAAGLAIAVAGVIAGIDSSRVVDTLLPLIALFGIGGLLSYGNAPWRKLPTITAAALVSLLQAMAVEADGSMNRTT